MEDLTEIRVSCISWWIYEFAKIAGSPILSQAPRIPSSIWELERILVRIPMAQHFDSQCTRSSSRGFPDHPCDCDFNPLRHLLSQYSECLWSQLVSKVSGFLVHQGTVKPAQNLSSSLSHLEFWSCQAWCLYGRTL